MILFVGDKPSKRTDPDVPFKGASCEKRLMDWIYRITLDEFIIHNRTDPKFKAAVLCAIALDWPIIALGNEASKALGEVSHFKLPHPSGRNRQLNDKMFIEQKLEECRIFINKAKV